MKINRLVSNFIGKNIESNNKINMLKGKLLQAKGKNVLIELKNGEIIQAKTEIDLSQFLNLEIDFQAIEDNDGTINLILKENLDNLANVDIDDKIEVLLKNNSIPETKENIKLVKNMMKNNIPIKKENIIENIKISNKVMELKNLKETDEIELILETIDLEDHNELPEMSRDFETEHFNPLIEEDDLILEKELNTPSIKTKRDMKSLVFEELKEKIGKSEQDLGQINIKNIIVKEESSTNLDGNSQLLDEIESFKSEIIDFFSKMEFNLTEEKVIKLATFFNKYELEPSYENIKTILELDITPFEFIDDLEFFNHILDEVLEYTLNDIEEDNELITKEDIKRTIEKLDKNLKNEPKKEVSLKDGFKKIDTLKNINKEVYFHTIPLSYGEKNLKGALNIIKDKKSSNKIGDKDYSVLINLDTNLLGVIRTHIKFKDKELDIQINISEEDLYLFKNSKEILMERITNLGYQVKALNFVFEEEISILDNDSWLSDEINIMDIRV